MANNIEKAVKYLGDPENFNQIFKDGALTSDLQTEAHQMKVLDANTVKLPRYRFSSTTMGTYDRATGAPDLDLNETWDTYPITQDKGNSIYLDVLDNEETLGEGIIRRANELTRTIIVPGVDTYRFSKLATVPTPAAVPSVVGAKIITQAGTDATNVVTRIDTGVEYMNEKEVPKEGRILYVSPATKNKIQRSSDITKNFYVQNGGGEVNTLIYYYNDMKVVEVPTARLGANIDFIIVSPKAVASQVKFNESQMVDATATTPNKFGNFWKYRINYDLWHTQGAAIQEGTSPNFVLVNPGVYVHKSA